MQSSSILIILISVSVDASRILGIFPVPSISHQVVYRAYVEELAKRGHEFIVLTPDPTHRNDKLYENITEIDLHDVSYPIWKKFNFALMRKEIPNPKEMMSQMYDAILQIVDAQLSSPQVKALINSKDEKFDLVVVEAIIPPYQLFAHHFKTPLVGIISMLGLNENFENMGSPTHSLLYSDPMMQYEGELDLWQKLNIIYSDIMNRYMNWQKIDSIHQLSIKHFGNDMPSIKEVENNYDLIFMNTHQVISGIRPLVPGIVYLGSMHINPKKALPKELQIFLDQSTQGVIYMSLGSNVLSKDLSPETLSIFLNAFRSLPYNILWKWENETMPNKPPNVHLSKWLPQQDLLGHPNVRVFITQGGQQSMEEAIHNGVPLIGIPFIADQFLNVQRMGSWGIGKGLDIQTITEDSLKHYILQVAENTTYRDKARRLGELLRDEPMSSRERAVWWTEYVLRHGGARHLRAPGADTRWWQYFMLDVLAALLAAAASALLLLWAAAAKLRAILIAFIRTDRKSKDQ